MPNSFRPGDTIEINTNDFANPKWVEAVARSFRFDEQKQRLVWLEATIDGKTWVSGKGDDDFMYLFVRTKVDLTHYPHECPKCHKPAYIGMGNVDCSAKCGV